MHRAAQPRNWAEEFLKRFKSNLHNWITIGGAGMPDFLNGLGN